MSAAIEVGTLPRRRWRPRFLRSWTARVGLVIGLFVVGIAVVGPVFAPHGPSAIVDIPFSSPSLDYPLGTDQLGRDVLSRTLNGGRSVLVLATIATAIGYLLGLTVGVVAGYKGGVADTALMRTSDVLLAVPPLLVVLILTTGLDAGVAPLIAGVAITSMPGIARITRAATLEVVGKSYVEAAIARGERLASIVTREILPNIAPTIAADAGPRFTVSILVIAGLNYLGLGIQPPAADWGVMINENQLGLSLQPWAVIAPAVLIALLTISINLVADAAVRSLGRSTGEVFQQR